MKTHNTELLHSRLQLNEQIWCTTLLDCLETSEVLLESSQGRKALKSTVEVTLGSKHWPTGPTKLTFHYKLLLFQPFSSDHTAFYY